MNIYRHPVYTHSVKWGHPYVITRIAVVVSKDPICSLNHEQLVSESRGAGSGSTHSATHSGVGEWEIALEFGMRGMRRMERAPNSASVCVSPTRT